MKKQEKPQAETSPVKAKELTPQPPSTSEEIGGAKGPEPTRYGDWQHKGRVSDF